MSASAPRPDARPPDDSIPDGRPDALMVFDGVCNVCSGYVRLVLVMDRRGLIRFTPIQSPYGRLLAERHGVDPDDPSTFLFFDRGRAIEGTDAMAAMVARLPRPWRWLRVLSAIPRPLRDGVYRWIARNRYRILGKRRSCMVAPAQFRARFVEAIPTAGEPQDQPDGGARPVQRSSAGSSRRVPMP